ncbi:phosphatidate phosphatase LPIN2 isoform X1 [Lutzomyia longipalpis]|uniref:phosphatidate phosphatase n=1 Tax=Lutzomyia longipalpis TaxID=7200 RepID=A0A7G3AXX6_LUTLO|nr:phosphatidate phosphatase LPIN2 isoform X1 [Lutzomyia longipalpis]XP_055689859.1 phosphatidate phosphatase LPIN2 isoform X1 [Lutzomyia longipalpis]
MNSLVKVFSNFKEFYSEINGATLTGAIDVVVVEQPDGTFLSSPFHVRFGKLGVLRSREKIVDIEVNGEPIDIHMKLGESGEAFFVEECPEDDLEELPSNLATSPIPSSEFSSSKLAQTSDFVSSKEDELQIPKPRRNSIDLLIDEKDGDGVVGKKFENQVSDYAHRRYTDNTMERRDLEASKKEFTTQKIRQQWAEQQQDEDSLLAGIQESDWRNSTAVEDTKDVEKVVEKVLERVEEVEQVPKEESKSKKKRRKKSIMKKKNAQRKNSSSSGGSIQGEPAEVGAIEEPQTSSTEGSPIVSAEVKVEEKPATGQSSMTSSRILDLDIHFFSDTDVATGHSPRTSRPSTPIQSDTEFEVSQREKGAADCMTSSASWKWGELPTQDDVVDDKEATKQAQRNSMLSGMFSFMKQNKKFRNSAPEGLYLADIDPESMDPEVAALYFPEHTRKSFGMDEGAHSKGHREDEEDRESGNGTSLPQSPSSIDGAKSLDSDYEDGKISDKYLDLMAMSLCGGLDGNNVPSDEEFDRHLITYSEVCRNPSLFSSPNLVVRLNGKHYSWAAACPIVMTLIAFQKPLPNATIDKLVAEVKEEASAAEAHDGTVANVTQIEPKRSYSWWYWRRSGAAVDKGQEVKGLPPSVELGEGKEDFKEDDRKEDSMSFASSTAIDIQQGGGGDLSPGGKGMEKFRKTLRLSSDQIKSLNLKNGINEIEFSVTTAYQGTSRCKCYLFRWRYNDKVVISDIDGTITRSDVLGHILPMVGKDWAQIGVADLFSKIEENGYKLLYLSARAIGQSRATRDYLRSIRQGDVQLPDGPLLLNPTSLISAFHREVIEKKPEQFKIACLSDIQALFPQNPFYAGYGNKINDVWAYRAVGIPIMRIFTINTKGELRHELTQTFQSTYCRLADIVDQLFPPILADDFQSNEYSTFRYWRDPLPDINFLDIEGAAMAPLAAPTATPTADLVPPQGAAE